MFVHKKFSKDYNNREVPSFYNEVVNISYSRKT